MTSTKSALLCASNENFDNNVTWNLDMPKDIVAGTDKVTASINAELLGQTIEVRTFYIKTNHFYRYSKNRYSFLFCT